MLILIMQTQSESRTVNTKITFNRMILNERSPIKNNENLVKKCDEISPVILNDILGAAYNSRCVCVCFKLILIKL